MGVTIFAIGVSQVYLPELNDMASEPKARVCRLLSILGESRALQYIFSVSDGTALGSIVDRLRVVRDL